MDPDHVERLIRQGSTAAAEIILTERAYHEAGHVVACLEFGFAFRYVTLRPRGRELVGLVKTRPARRDVQDPREVVLCLAGVVAEARHLLERHGVDPVNERDVIREAQDSLWGHASDLDRAMPEMWEALEKAGPRDDGVPCSEGQSQQKTALEGLWLEAASLVFRRWAQVSEIAHSLVKQRTLTRRDVVAMIARE